MIINLLIEKCRELAMVSFSESQYRRNSYLMSSKLFLVTRRNLYHFKCMLISFSLTIKLKRARNYSWTFIIRYNAVNNAQCMDTAKKRGEYVEFAQIRWILIFTVKLKISFGCQRILVILLHRWNRSFVSFVYAWKF